MTLTEKIIAFEEDELDFDEIQGLFQELVDTGMAWKLQGMYGRIAQNMIEQGFITG